MPYKDIYGGKFMAESIMKKDPKDWKLIASGTGSGTLTFPDLETNGYVDVFVGTNAYNGVNIPVNYLTTSRTVVFGAYYQGSAGALRQGTLTKTSFAPNFAYTDSQNVMSSTTWYIWAR